MRKRLLISFIAAMLMLPSAAFATDEAPARDSDVARESDGDGQDGREEDKAEEPQSDETDRVKPTDEIDRRCLDVDKVTDRCCKHFADENPQRCRDYLCRPIDVLSDRCCRYFADEHPERCRDHCVETDVVSDRCCLHLADDHPERCRDHRVDPPNYRKLFWRLVHAGEWQLLVRLLTHLGLI